MKQWSAVILPAMLLLVCPWALHAQTANLPLETMQVKPVSPTGREVSVDAVVEAVHQATLSTQVPGAVVSLSVKAGDRVRAGQELARIDARVAQQQVVGSTAQLEAAQAQFKVATRELERQQQLFQKQYISQGALDRAQAQWEAAQAQVQSLQAQTRISQAQTGFFSVQAPFGGVVSEVPVTLGDMAMPGRPLVVMHDPAALRITANVAQALMPVTAGTAQPVRYEIAGQGGVHIARQVQWLPTVDAATHTVQLRLALPAQATGVIPGMFARVWIPVADGRAAARVQVPLRAVVRRAEMTGLYVLDAQNRPRLRQVRLGASTGEQVEVLSGVSTGDHVVLDPARVGTTR